MVNVTVQPPELVPRRARLEHLERMVRVVVEHQLSILRRRHPILIDLPSNQGRTEEVRGRAIGLRGLIRRARVGSDVTRTAK